MDAPAPPHSPDFDGDRMPGVLGRIRRSQHRDRVVGLVDQGMLAVTRFGAMLLFARLLETDDFASFALLVSISFILSNFQNSITVLPFIVSCPTVEMVKKDGDLWFWLDVVLAIVIAVVLALVAGGMMLFGAAEWSTRSVAFSALGAPFLMMFMFSRRRMYQSRNYRKVLELAAVHLLAYALGIGMAYMTAPDPLWALLTFAFAPAAALVYGLFGQARVRSGPCRRMWSAWKATHGFSFWAFLGFIARVFYNNGLNIMLAGFVGAIGTAVFSATRTVIQPVVTLTNAVDLIDKPRAGRALVEKGKVGLRKSVHGTRKMLLTLGVPYLILVAVFSDEILGLLYPGKFEGYSLELRLWALAVFIQLFAQPLMTQIITLRNSRALFFGSLTGAAVALSIALLTMEQYGVPAALIAMSAGRLIGLLLLMVTLSRWNPFGEGSMKAPNEISDGNS